MADIQAVCSCGQIFIMKNDEVKRCPKCGKPHRGSAAPKEIFVMMK